LESVHPEEWADRNRNQDVFHPGRRNQDLQEQREQLPELVLMPVLLLMLVEQLLALLWIDLKQAPELQLFPVLVPE
jgi:hypothetical protein